MSVKYELNINILNKYLLLALFLGTVLGFTDITMIKTTVKL